MLILWLPILSGFIVAFVFYIGYVIAPIRSLVLESRKTTKKPNLSVSIMDLFALVALAQIPLILMAGPGASFRHDEIQLAIIILILSLVLSSLVWFGGIQTLNSINVDDVKARIAFLTFVLPLAIGAAFLGLPLMLNAVFHVVDGTITDSFLGIAMFTSLTYILRKASRWIAGKSLLRTN